jgi:hypothetical protein
MKLQSVIKALYFLACIFTILFSTIGKIDWMLWSKAFVLPSALWYYLNATNYKIDFVQAGVFISCFIGDIYRLIFPNNYETGQVLSFLTAYILLLYYIFPSFIKINLKYKYNLLLLVLIVISLSTLSYFILTLKFEKMQINILYLILYSVILETLFCVAMVEYNHRITLVSVNLLMLIILFVFSDMFYMIDKFYLSFIVFNFTQIFTQVFSYYFLVIFFILNNKQINKLN